MTWQSKSAAIAIAIMAMSLHSSSVQAMPEQGKVVAGQGEIARPDEKTMVINQKTDRLALDWQKFNIAKDEKVHFDQNSKSAIALNRVVGDGRSIIDGSLSAKGHVSSSSTRTACSSARTAASTSAASSPRRPT